MNTKIPSYWRDANHIRTVRDQLHEEARALQTRVAARIEQEGQGFSPEESLTHAELLDALDRTTTAMLARQAAAAPLVVRDVAGGEHDITAAYAQAAERGRAAGGTAPADPGSAHAGAVEFRPGGRTLGALLVRDRAFQALRGIPAALRVSQGFDLDLRDLAGTTCGPLLVPPPPPPPMPAPLVALPPPLRVSELLLHKPAGEVCKYLQLTARTGGTAVVAPGGTKPAVTLNGSFLDAVFEKIAGITTVTDEQLEDSNDTLADIINRELYVDLANKIDAEVLSAPGGAGRFLGLLPGATGPDTAHVAGTPPVASILAEVGALFDASGEMADSVVVNFKTAVACASVLATTSGVFMTGAPLLAPTPAWAGGLRVAIEPTMADGVALVGSFARGAELVSKRGFRFDRLSSGDAWMANQTLFRVETRVALLILRPLSFGTVTGLPGGA